MFQSSLGLAIVGKNANREVLVAGQPCGSMYDFDDAAVFSNTGTSVTRLALDVVFF